MSKILIVIVSIIVTIFGGLLCFFLTILSENKEELWERIIKGKK